MRWAGGCQARGGRATTIFDERALTFIVSSWRCDWEAADFGARPVGFDHGAHVPIVCVFVNRPAGDGVDVYTSGPPESTEIFARSLTEATGG